MEFYKYLKSILKAGVISEDTKKELKSKFEELGEEEKELMKDDYKKALELKAEEEEKEDDEEDEVVGKMEKMISKAAENLEEKTVDALKKQVAEIKRQMEKKVGVYNQDIQKNEKRKNLNTKIKGLLSAIVNNDTATLKEMTTSESSPSAGYTIDSELSAEIRHLMTDYGVARRESMTLQLSKGSYKANSLTTDVSVYWVDEGAKIKSTQPVLGQDELTLKKMGAIATLTSELLEDEEIDLFSFVASRVAEGLAEAEDEAFFNGDGTATYGSFTGLLENSDVNEVEITGTDFSDVGAEDLIDMVDATPQGALGNAKYYLHRTIMSYVRKLKATDGQYIYQAPSQSGPATIWGYPVVLVEAMPAKGDSAAETSFVLFGDLKKATILGYKGGIQAKRFDAGTVRNVADNADINLITTDREAIRWTERFGFIVVIPSAVTKLTTAAS